MTYYIKRGNEITLSSENSQMVTTTLPVGTYALKFNEPMELFYLTQVDDMTVPEKIYGHSVGENADRIIKKFNSQERSLGVLLEGLKGTGKTMLMKTLSARLREEGVSTILISDAYAGTAFNTFLGQIDVPAVVVFDEFEKVYRESEHQEALLSVFDGTTEHKKLFILTVNGRVNEFLLNRPGRMHYRIKFGGLEKDFVSQYLDDALVNQENRKGIENIADTFSDLSFDMLKAIVDEMNLFSFTAQEAVKNLNVDVFGSRVTYELTAMVNGVPARSVHPLIVTEVPFVHSPQFYVHVYTDGKGKEAFKDETICFTQSDLLSIANGGIVSLKKTHEKKEVIVILEKQKPFSFDFDAF